MKYLDTVLPAIPRLFVATGRSKERSLLHDAIEYLKATDQAELLVLEGSMEYDREQICTGVVQLIRQPERGIPLNLRATIQPLSLTKLSAYLIPPLILAFGGWVLWSRLGGKQRESIRKSILTVIRSPFPILTSSVSLSAEGQK